jgi:aspartyl-tRNA(Asn)/glutamyl-tRNA(Gln) amidotransferase subunit A
VTLAPESALARTQRSLKRIEALDGQLRSCVVVRYDAAAEAARVDASRRGGALAGWTVAVKDNIDVAGTVRSDGVGPPHPPPAAADSVAVGRLRAAGAVVVAKTNLEQLSFGATTQNPTWGRCRNPWDRSRIPGGSSGGSAVAVAASLVDASLGTDTGGSLRNPASFCGVCALRPTHGLVPMTGVTPLSPSMDVIGPIARRVVDLRRLLTVLVDVTDEAVAQSLPGLAVGVPSAYFLDELDQNVARGFDALLALFCGCGARLSPVRLARVADVPDAMATLQNAEAARSLRAYWDDPRLSDGVRERLDLGRAVTDQQYELASRIADAWRRTVREAFETVSVIVTPATPFVAPRIGADNLIVLSRQINRFTGCWSLARTPALGLPLPLSSDGLPVGGQLVAPELADWRLLAIGEAIQSVSDWHERLPCAPQ